MTFRRNNRKLFPMNTFFYDDNESKQESMEESHRHVFVMKVQKRRR